MGIIDSMVDVLAEEEVCRKCGADIREGSQFCYNCGRSLTSDPDAGEVVERSIDGLSEQPIAKPIIDPTPETTHRPDAHAAEKGSKTARPPRKAEQLESAAAIKRRRRTASEKPVDVVWEQPARISKGFVVATVIFLLIALVIIYLAVYLK